MSIQPNAHLLGVYRDRERMSERTDYVCLDRNERVTPFRQEVFDEMMSGLTPCHYSHYPDPSPLYAELSNHLQIPESHIYVTPGSDAAIRMIFSAYASPGDVILLPEFTYAMYQIYAQLLQASVTTAPFKEDLQLDAESYLRLLEKRPRIAVLANPNQPTGTTIDPQLVARVASQARESNTLLVIDEAYYPFYSETSVRLLRSFDNVAVLRSFSKAAGIAGLRLGYLAGHPTIVDGVHRVRGAHEVNAVAIAAGTYILKHPRIMTDYVKEVESGLNVLKEAAQRLGLGLPPSSANFQLIQVPEGIEAGEVVDAMKKRGYLVKGPFSAPVLSRFVRVTLAGADVMEGFVAALEDALARLGWKPCS